MIAYSLPSISGRASNEIGNKNFTFKYKRQNHRMRYQRKESIAYRWCRFDCGGNQSSKAYIYIFILHEGAVSIFTDEILPNSHHTEQKILIMLSSKIIK